MYVPAVLEDRPRNVRLVNALLNHNARRHLGVVAAGGHDHVPPVYGFVSDLLRLGVLDVVRVVGHDPLAALTSIGSTDR